MFHRAQNGTLSLSPQDCEDIARRAETLRVTVSFDPMGLRLSKTKFSLRGEFSKSEIIPWVIFAQHRCPAESIKADIQRIADEIDQAIAAGRGRF